MAETCRALLHINEGKVVNATVAIRGTLVSPPSSVGQVEICLGNTKVFPALTELIDLINKGVLVKRQ